MEKVKLIWDFRGAAAAQTAVHHAKHLTEFAAAEHANFYEIGSENVSEFHSLAFVIVQRDEILKYRDILKPHRAVLAD
ncbi:hypothetical protein [Flavobacterium sp.]|uniref:hypothetical protein n=1 Tax=Flavobacterium sp. TaxID=239 RepID=UPI003B9D8B2C